MIYDDVTFVFLAVAVIVILRSIYVFGTFMISLAWLKRQHNCVQDETKPNFVVIIAALWEQGTLRETTEWFLSMSYPKYKLKIVLVTTEREFSRPIYPNGETTVGVAKSLQDKYPSNVEHMHYMDASGIKAHQLNFVLDQILTGSSASDRNVFVSFYDSDSRPHPDTFRYVSLLSKDPEQRAFQQSAVFFKNFSDMKCKNSFLAKKLLQTNAIFQTRWTLAHEIPRILRQRYAIRRWKRRLFLSHCVGHGLFLRKDLVRELRHIPAETMTEDLFLGFVLSLAGEPIQAMPVLESSDSPDSTREMLLQKYVWFFGPLDHLTYGKLFLKDNPKQTPVWLVGLFVVKGLLPALAWLLSGWMLLFVIVYPFFAGEWWVSVLSVCATCLYLSTFLITILSYVQLNYTAGVSKSMRRMDIVWITLLLLLLVVLHSLPPLMSVAAKLRSVCTGKNPRKPKIER